MIKMMKDFGWREDIFVYDEEFLKENFYKNSIKIFFQTFEKILQDLQKK